MARFGEFCACRANFVPLWQSTTRAGRTLYRIQGGCGVSRHNRTPSATGVEGAGVSGGPVCGAHGRWQGLARLRADAPSYTSATRRRRCGGRRRVRRARVYRWAAAGPGRGTGGRWQGPTAVPVGGGGVRLWCPWAAGPGRGARGWRQGQGGPRDRPLRAAGSRVAISRAGRRPPAHTAAGPHKATQWSARNTSGATSNTTTGTTPTRPGIQKTDIRIGCRPVVELGGFEPPTFSLRTRRATNCAIAPRTRTA